jgi:hypothetical protein
MTITKVAELAAILRADPAERVVCTHEPEHQRTAWHLVARRTEIDQAVIVQMIDPDQDPRLEPVQDGLFPGTSQTFQFFETLQKTVRGKRGRPKLGGPRPDAAERMAKSRQRQEKRRVHTLLLVAALAEMAPELSRKKLEQHHVFGPILRDATFAAKALTLSALD